MVVAVALLLWPITTTSATIQFVTAGSSPVRLFYFVSLTVGLLAVVAAPLKWSTGLSWWKVLLPLSLKDRVETRRVSEESHSTDRTSPGEQDWRPTGSCKGRSDELLQSREKLQVVGLKTESGLSSALRATARWVKVLLLSLLPLFIVWTIIPGSQLRPQLFTAGLQRLRPTFTFPRHYADQDARYPSTHGCTHVTCGLAEEVLSGIKAERQGVTFAAEVGEAWCVDSDGSRFQGYYSRAEGNIGRTSDWHSIPACTFTNYRAENRSHVQLQGAGHCRRVWFRTEAVQTKLIRCDRGGAGGWPGQPEANCSLDQMGMPEPEEYGDGGQLGIGIWLRLEVDGRSGCDRSLQLESSLGPRSRGTPTSRPTSGQPNSGPNMVGFSNR